jgi:hypothetical protein
MRNLLDRLAAPDCPRLGFQWDRCGVHYVEPIEARTYGLTHEATREAAMAAFAKSGGGSEP